MAERHILLTAYSPVSSNTFHERLNQIEKSLAYLKLSEKNTKEELEKVKLEVNNLEEIKIERINTKRDR